MTGPNSCPTVKVKPWGKGQGKFVEINVEDFNAETHELFDGEVAPEKVSLEHAKSVFESAKSVFDNLTPEQRDELAKLMEATKPAEPEAKVDALDHDANGKKGGAKKAANAPAPVETPAAINPAAGWGAPE